MKLSEIASKIHAHLQRFEVDPVINKYKEGTTLSPYYNVNCYATSKQVHVTYISFKGNSGLSKKDAEKYLTWLDAGNVGRHFGVIK